MNRKLNLSYRSKCYQQFCLLCFSDKKLPLKMELYRHYLYFVMGVYSILDSIKKGLNLNR